MKSLLSKQAERFLREQKNYRRWLAVFLCLAVIVTIGTTAALKYKGIAVTTDAAESEEIHTDVEAVSEVVENEIKRHVHTEECYELQLVCGYPADEEEAEAGSSVQASESGSKTESKAPSKTEAPAETPSETGGHTHSDSCYTVTGGTETLTCGKEEHTHSDSCYSTKTVTETETETDEDGNETQKTVEKEETVLSCGKSEHEHGSSCYTSEGGERVLTCGQEESAPAAHAAEAEAAPAAEEAPEAPAAEEIPVTEEDQSTDETSVTEEVPSVDETPAGEEETPSAEVIPEEEKETPAADASSEEETASAETEDAEHVHDDTCYGLVLICGFEDALSDEMNLVQTAETENYKVTVTYSESAEIDLNDAELRVVEYAKDSTRYIERCEELGYQPDFLLNIGFFSGDNEVEPKKPVDVKITDKNVKDAVGYEIVHFADSGTEQVDNNITKTNGGVEMEFSTDSFTDWAGFAVQNEESGSQVAEVAPISGLVHEKKVEPVRDSEGKLKYYDLTLNVKGSVANSDEKAKLDIVFVMDTSGSMAWNVDGNSATTNKPSRRKLANEAITNLVNDLDAGDSGIDAQYKLITFSNSASTSNARNWQTGTTLKNNLPSSASGGTNYQDALEAAGSAVNSSRTDAKTVVIFLTDGAPTYYNNGGNGSSTTPATVNGAITGAGKITCDYFFAVGFGAEMTKNTNVGSSGRTAYEIIKAVADAANAKEGSDATATTDLTKYFSAFKESLKNIIATDVEFTDKLTQEVDIVDEAGEKVENPNADNWEIKIYDAGGKDVTETEKPKAGMQVSYDNTNGLKVTFGKDYVLEKDYTYSVTTKIAANDLAKAKYAINGYIYSDKGDENTGSESSNRQGIYCNEENSAKVSYNYIVNNEKSDKKTELDYSRPVVQLGEKPTPPPLVDQEMTHDKYIKKVTGESDVYDLTLDLTGRVGSTTKPAYYDILFVVDTSGSMKYGLKTNSAVSSSSQRLTYAKTAINNLIDSIEGNKNIVAKYSLISFGNDAQLKKDWDTAQRVKTAVSNLSADGGTNYQAGLVKARDQLNKDSGVLTDASEDSEVTKVVVFLTDGQPTYYLGKGEWVWNGWDYDYKYTVSNEGTAREGGGSYTTANDYNGAIMGAQAVSCNYFYSIGFGPGMTSNTSVYNGKNAAQVLADVTNATNATVKNTITTGSVDGLQKAFDDIQGIVNEFHCHDVTVTDTLSPYVEVNTKINADETKIPAALTIEIAKINSDGTKGEVVAHSTNGNVISGAKVALPATKTNHAAGNENQSLGDLTARYDETAKQIILDFPNSYKLESGYKYYVTVQIRASEEAYKQAENLDVDEKGNLIYPNEGGPKTDHPDTAEANWISEGKPGFFTNTKAEVSFTYDDGENKGKEETEEYPYPVIKVNPAKLTLKKTVAGLTEADTAELFANMQFIVDGDTRSIINLKGFVNESKTTDAEGKEIVNYTLKEDIEKTNNNDGSVTYTIFTDKEVVPGTHTVTEVWGVADVNNYTRTTSYKVNSGAVVKADESGNVDAEVTVEANGTGTVEFINSYTAITETIQIKKVDGDGNSKKTEGSEDSEGLFTGLEFLVKDGSVMENRETPMSEAELETALGGLTTVAVLTINNDGIAVLKSTNGVCQPLNNSGTDTLILPVGTYTVVENRTEQVPLTNYAEVYPFEIKVLPNGNFEKNDILGFPNNENVTFEKVEAESGNYYRVTVVNRNMKLAELQLLKVDQDRNKIVGLEGAVFDLYEEVKDGEDLKKAENLVSNVDGLIVSESLKNLESGKTYYLIETKAPAGYVLSAEKIKFTVSVKRDEKDGNLVTVTPGNNKVTSFIAVPHTVKEDVDGVVTEKTEYAEYVAGNDDKPYSVDEDGNLVWTLAITNNTGAELPVTGGPGTAAYTFGGLAVIAAGLMYSLSMRRKREKGGLNS